MSGKSDREELRRRLEQAKRAVALLNDPVTTERLLILVRDLQEHLREPAMENPTEKQIVRRAYELWEQAGRPEGRDQEFYHLAEQELRDADKSSPLRTPDNL
jgi:hypothetical protein